MSSFANDNSGPLNYNFRETQPLNGREVKYYDGTTAQEPNSPVVSPTGSTPVVAEKKSKAEAKVAFRMLPVSVQNPLTGAVETIMKPVQKILMCFTGSDLCMFQ
ncbi:unnamed protein product [Oikopleura dioica]|uniref:Uncharacterized protein n=1 Tax=Oikopleura dioica TaxID=34765 RepID=E4X1Z8_OIKDI|nr:unnamed protein product [Oikopleura dioica]